MKKPTHIITTDVYYIDEYEGGHLDFKEEAVPAYEMNATEINEVLNYHHLNFLYIESGTEGYFDGEKFETIEGSDTRLSRYYAKTI